jgi:hypothetical protein
MVSRRIGTRKRQRPLRWGLVAFLSAHFLSLCTISPRVHADLLRQATQAHHTSAGHCSFPAAAPQTASPFTADHEKNREPACCDLEQANKAASISSIQTAPPPLPALAPVLVDADTLARGVPQLPPVRVLHSSHPPPLYLLHTALLI